jgi:hypothetical protein
MHRLNELWVLGRITKDGPQFSDTSAYDGLADRRGTPDGIEQGVLCDELAGLGH